jgi:hypothetical protein
MACLIECTKRANGWWFCYLPESGPDGECGPYTTRDEAEDDGRGVVRFYREA